MAVKCHALLAVAILWTAGAVHIDDCAFSLVESIPEGLKFPGGSPVYPATYLTWLELIKNAKKSINIASFYWTLRDKDVPSGGDNSSWMGEEVFVGLLNTGIRGDVKIRIAQNKPSRINPAVDTEDLARLGAAEVRSLDFNRFFGAGVLHTKFWVVDDIHVYIGSANMDYRALSQVKELGAVIHNCSSLALDLKKVFEVYWMVGEYNVVPPRWPANFSTDYNASNPLRMNLNDEAAEVYLSSSPPRFSPPGRSADVDAIINAINEAREFVYVAVMDFYPQIIYGGEDKGKLWTPLDTALRKAAVERGVEVRLLVSEWPSTRKSMLAFAASLGELGRAFKVQVKKFVVPKLPNNRTIPFTRVNHNKYMVTDQQAYIGTSNWSGDYFINTAGVGLNVFHKTAADQLKTVFLRDWESQYTHNIYSH